MIPPLKPDASDSPGSGSQDALFGKTLVRTGMLSAEQVDEAMRVQGAMKAQGVRMRLGELLVQKKLLTPRQVREALELVGKTLLHCPQCGKNYNVKNWSPGREVFCPTCSVALAAPASDSTIDAHDTKFLPPEPGAAAATEPQGKPFGRYRLLQELGKGGMGAVWKVWDTQLKRIVALKVILAGEGAAPAQIERFMREARLAAKLKHPNIVAVHDVGVHEGEHFFTTDFMFVWAKNLDRHANYPEKFAVMQRVPMPGTSGRGPCLTTCRN